MGVALQQLAAQAQHIFSIKISHLTVPQMNICFILRSDFVVVTVNQALQQQ